MNILRLEEKFKKLDEREKMIEYSFNPRVKSIPGIKRHRYFQDLSYDIEMDCQIYGFDPYCHSILYQNLVPQSQPEEPEVKIEEKEIHRPLATGSKPRKKTINKSALREIKYEPKQIAKLKKLEAGKKDKGGTSIEKMREQYDWLHNSEAPTSPITANSRPRVKVYTIDHTSLVTIEPQHKERPMTSQTFANTKKITSSETEALTFLLQFKCIYSL